MDKPKEKRMIAIKQVFNNDSTRSIHFDCSYPNIVEQLKEFGFVYWAENERPRGFLNVDACYDFNEVLKYIKFLGKEKPEKKKPLTHSRLSHRHKIAYACYSCKLKDCPFRWNPKRNFNNPEFAECPFYQRRDT